MKQNLGSIWKSNLSITKKIVRAPLRLIPSSMQMRVRSGINKGCLWIVGSGNHSCWLGVYEKDKQEKIHQALTPGMVVWDIGANVGFYTMAFSRAVSHKGHVTAFEPMCTNMHFLKAHVELNKCQNVDLVQAAVSSQENLIPFTFSGNSYTGKIELSSAYKIPSISLDWYLSTKNTRTPNLLKIDVEGAEAEVLKGALTLLNKTKPEIWLALHGEQATKDCSAILRKMNYKLYRLDGSLLNGDINTDEIIAKAA